MLKEMKGGGYGGGGWVGEGGVEVAGRGCCTAACLVQQATAVSCGPEAPGPQQTQVTTTSPLHMKHL
jgi:hypothetical protein